MERRQDDRDMLRKNGFEEAEVILLSRLRTDYTEQMKHQEAINNRRLEFIRWLVDTGKLSEQIA